MDKYRLSRQWQMSWCILSDISKRTLQSLRALNNFLKATGQRRSHRAIRFVYLHLLHTDTHVNVVVKEQDVFVYLHFLPISAYINDIVKKRYLFVTHVNVVVMELWFCLLILSSHVIAMKRYSLFTHIFII